MAVGWLSSSQNERYEGKNSYISLRRVLGSDGRVGPGSGGGVLDFRRAKRAVVGAEEGRPPRSGGIGRPKDAHMPGL